MQPTETYPETSSDQQPKQAGWWQQFWWRYSPHGELPLSSVASWIIHILVVVLIWFAAMTFVARDHGPPRVDVVSMGIGDGIGRGPAGGGDGMAPYAVNPFGACNKEVLMRQRFMVTPCFAQGRFDRHLTPKGIGHVASRQESQGRVS